MVEGFFFRFVFFRQGRNFYNLLSKSRSEISEINREDVGCFVVIGIKEINSVHFIDSGNKSIIAPILYLYLSSIQVKQELLGLLLLQKRIDVRKQHININLGLAFHQNKKTLSAIVVGVIFDEKLCLSVLSSIAHTKNTASFRSPGFRL